MSMQSLIERISTLTQAIEQSAANHNALVGRLAEAKSLLDMLNSVKIPGNVGEVIGAVDTVVDAVSDVITSATSKD